MCLDTVTSKRYKLRKDITAWKAGHVADGKYIPPIYDYRSYPFDVLVEADTETHCGRCSYIAGFHVCVSERAANGWGDHIIRVTIPKGTMIQRGKFCRDRVIVASQIIIHAPEE